MFMLFRIFFCEHFPTFINTFTKGTYDFYFPYVEIPASQTLRKYIFFGLSRSLSNSIEIASNFIISFLITYLSINTVDSGGNLHDSSTII